MTAKSNPEPLDEEGEAQDAPGEGEQFVVDGVEKVKQAIADQPQRVTPHFDDIVAAAEAILAHLYEWLQSVASARSGKTKK